MLRNYFKITWRNLLKHKLYAFINVAGLALGLACFIAVFLYVSHEFSYDRHFEHADRIYRVYVHEHSGEKYLGSALYATIPLPLAEAMRDEFPEVLHLTSIEEHPVLLGKERDHYMENGLWVDEHFFNVFSFQFLQGNPETALSHPESIVLTESLAFKLFGSDDPIGKSLTQQVRRDVKTFTVTGVIEDPPENTTFRFSFIAPLRSHIYYRNAWDTSNSHTFMVLAEGARSDEVEAKIPDLLKKYQKVSHWTNYHQDEYLLQPFNEFHLESNVNLDIGLKGNPTHVTIFSVVAVLVLLLACINYMNLAIARSMDRVREVGLRKVVGAARWQLIGQFLGESILLAFIALLVALGLLIFLLPVFAHLVERPIELNLFENKLLLPGLLLLVVMVGMLSGSYPAFFMSALRPVVVLKGKLKKNTSQISFQRILIIGQYAVSIMMMIGCLVIYTQYRFIQQKEIGYDREHIVTIRLHDFPSQEKYRVMKNEWLRNPHIVQVTASTELPINITSNTVINYEEGNTDNPLVIYRTNIDDNFLDVFGIELIAGRDLSQVSNSTSESVVLLNESALQALGWTPEEALGQHINGRGTVIGVVKDFQMLSMHHAVEPLMLSMQDKARFEYISVKIRPEDIPGTLAVLENTVKQHSNFPFEYSFLDDAFDQLYKTEVRMGEIIGFFTLLSILIASMGLFGLAAFAAGQRTKEIGIRKVLGASVQGIAGMLSKDFLKMVMLGFLVAIPVAWYAMSQWLQDFAYRIDLEWWMFALAGLLAVVIALLTVSFQSVKAALMNPVKSLRSE